MINTVLIVRHLIYHIVMLNTISPKSLYTTVKIDVPRVFRIAIAQYLE